MKVDFISFAGPRQSKLFFILLFGASVVAAPPSRMIVHGIPSDSKVYLNSLDRTSYLKGDGTFEIEFAHGLPNQLKPYEFFIYSGGVLKASHGFQKHFSLIEGETFVSDFSNFTRMESLVRKSPSSKESRFSFWGIPQGFDLKPSIPAKASRLPSGEIQFIFPVTPEESRKVFEFRLVSRSGSSSEQDWRLASLLTPGEHKHFSIDDFRNMNRAARFEILVTRKTKVSVNGKPTQTEGEVRLFETPPLARGETFKADVVLSFNHALTGEAILEKHQIELHPGEHKKLSFPLRRAGHL